jgi:hypothetical protein
MDERPGAVLETAVLDAEPVPHAEPLTDEQLNQQISDTFPELFKLFHELGQRIAVEFGFNGSDAIALMKLDAPLTMKELGQRMGCDPSFITTIADSQDPAIPRAHDPGAVVYRPGHRRAPVPARAHEENDPIARREVMMSQPRLQSRQM